MEENKHIMDVWLKEKLVAVDAPPLMSWNEFSALNADKIPGKKGNSGYMYVSIGVIAILLLVGAYFLSTNNPQKPIAQAEEPKIGEISKLNQTESPEQISKPLATTSSQNADKNAVENEKISNINNAEVPVNQENDKQAMYERMVAESEQQKNENREQLEKIADDLDITLPTEQEFNSGFYVSPGRGETVTLHKPDKFLVARSRENGILIDLRSASDFAEGHLRGAVNIEFKVSDFRQKVSKYKRDKHMFVYCNDGEVSRSAMALLWKSGFYTVHILQGGVDAWKKANYTLIKN